MTRKIPVPVIDLFAGPGGLGEGFSALRDERGNHLFRLGASIEKDSTAHLTLSLRGLFRAFADGKVPDCYYDYLRGNISRKELFDHPSIRTEAKAALSEAHRAELGKTPHKTIDSWISTALGDANEWVLIGGPPCQAYSIAGRSRRTHEDTAKFENDEKHFLYKEYLRIIHKFSPSVFVMENVKGILTSKHGGSPIFDQILRDLSSPGGDFAYRIRSFAVPGSGDDLSNRDFIIESERFGVPQSRHRVIIFGIRADLADTTTALRDEPGRFALSPSPRPVTVAQAISDLPPLRSRLSREPDSHGAWLSALETATDGFKWRRDLKRATYEEEIRRASAKAARHESYGGPFVAGGASATDSGLPADLRSWYLDPRLGGFPQHETRRHMRSDLHRYMFAACHARLQGASPKLVDFPSRLLPAHGNVDAEDVPFEDRFRVQLASEPSTTVVSHISKDGHYYIHYDPSQCRSLTVREVARLQTFPDNYFFEGPRTDQYTQVGNAVPPWLARQIAQIVFRFLKASRR